MTREEIIKSALKFLVQKQIEQGSWGFSDRNENEISWDKVLEWLEQPWPSHCKACKYFEYDSMAKVDGIPLIVAHEICKRWGDGCKTSENGYCFLYEPQEMEVDG